MRSAKDCVCTKNSTPSRAAISPSMRLMVQRSRRARARMKTSGTPYSTYSSRLALGVMLERPALSASTMLKPMPPAQSSRASAVARQPSAARSRWARHRQAAAASNGAAVRKAKDPPPAVPGQNATTNPWHSTYSSASTTGMHSPHP